MNFIQELLCRIRSKSPALFVKLQWLSGSLAATSFILQRIILDKVWQSHSSDKISIICGYFITAGITMFAVSNLPTKSAPVPDLRTADDESGLVGGRPDDRNPPPKPK